MSKHSILLNLVKEEGIVKTILEMEQQMIFAEISQKLENYCDKNKVELPIHYCGQNYNYIRGIPEMVCEVMEKVYYKKFREHFFNKYDSQKYYDVNGVLDEIEPVIFQDIIGEEYYDKIIELYGIVEDLFCGEFLECTLYFELGNLVFDRKIKKLTGNIKKDKIKILKLFRKVFKFCLNDTLKSYKGAYDKYQTWKKDYLEDACSEDELDEDEEERYGKDYYDHYKNAIKEFSKSLRRLIKYIEKYD